MRHNGLTFSVFHDMCRYYRSGVENWNAFGDKFALGRSGNCQVSILEVVVDKYLLVGILGNTNNCDTDIGDMIVDILNSNLGMIGGTGFLKIEVLKIEVLKIEELSIDILDGGVIDGILVLFQRCQQSRQERC